MDDDMDLSSKKDRGVKSGRRARKEAAEPETAAGPDPLEDVSEENLAQRDADTKPARGPDAPKRPRRVGGWGDDSGKKRNMDDFFEDERLKPQTAERDDDSDPDIPVIPDLEDTVDDDMTVQVAVAPNVQINRVATMKELDNDLVRHAAFLTLDNEVDLKLLEKCLASELEVVEEDKPWDWNRLFTEVSSELLSEWEVSEEKAPNSDGLSKEANTAA